MAGGHGTAIAWGQEAEAAGLPKADLVGIAFATFGLVAGGIVGGPLVGAFFIDLLNALVIKFFVGLPMLQQVPLPGV